MLAFHQDQERLAALDRYDVLDTPKEEAFDRITRLTKKIFNVPIAAVSVIDGHRQWFKSCTGFDAAETPRAHAFCSHTIQRSEPLIVPDASKDPRFEQNPYVAGEPHVRFYAGIPLETADGQRIGALCAVDTKPREMAPDEVEILSDLGRMVMDELELRVLATTDSLTGALSRRAFKDEARRATMLALRHHHDLSCVTFDLDHFKVVNDRYGHAAGDTILIQTVRACRGQLRQSDSLGRMGGEEFAVTLPHTNRAGAIDVAEKLRAAIQAQSFTFGSHPIAVTASFGIASLDPATRDVEALLMQADAALYQAKAAGRNRCVPSPSPEKAMAALRRRVLKGGQILLVSRVMRASLSDSWTGKITLPARFIADPARRRRSGNPDELVAFKVCGATCDSVDILSRPFWLPETVDTGDWIEIGHIGAYSLALRTRFNGFYPDTVVEVDTPFEDEKGPEGFAAIETMAD